VSINSMLYLCNLSSDSSTTTIQPLSSNAASNLKDLLPNSSVNNTRTTGRSTAAKGRGREGVPSEDAVSGSVCLKRKRCGLPTTPHALNFSISTGTGRKWESHDLRGGL
jgi:hypothetical protein